MSTFHPDQNLPGCMMPDGGDCCAGHAAVVEDWHRQRRRIEELEADARGRAQASPVLWCCHARGPDDVYAAPDYATALAWSDTLNALNWDTGDARYVKPRGFKNPSLYEECLIKAVPAPWPHSEESHAEDLPRSIEGFAIPSAHQNTPTTHHQQEK